MTDRGRILMISTHGYVAASPELGRPDTGGQVVYVLELSRTLARLGYEVDILTRQFDGSAEEEPVAPGVRILRIPCGGPDFIEKERLSKFIPELAEGVITFARRRRLDYRWVNSHYWDAGLAGEILAGIWRVPHIHTPHSLGAWKRDQMSGDPADLERQYNFAERIASERRIMHDCQVALATSREQLRILRSDDYCVPREKLAVIPPGYDDLRFFPVSAASREAMRRQRGFDRPTILALGRIAANKGYDLLIEAMATVVSRCNDAQLLLAIGGTSPSADESEYVDQLCCQARSLGIADHVRFAGYVPDDELANLYRAADIFALSSRYEPFGMTAVEAMACGTPTVVTTEGGLCEELVWGRDALSADPRDPEALGHTLLQILQNRRLQRQLSRHGAEQVRKWYTWTAIASRVVLLADGLQAGWRSCREEFRLVRSLSIMEEAS